MEGGALLDYGTFGCVFDPPLKCSGRPGADSASHKVGKLGERIDIRNELQASKVLSGIANSKEYFVLADLKSVCTYDKIVKDPVAKKDIKECTIECKTLREHGTSQTIYYSMPFGGISIEKFFGGIVKGAKREPLHPRVVITHLLEACAELALNNYVHYDLHTGNILFDEKTRLPRLIDFGMSFSPNIIDKDFLANNWKTYGPVHPVEPPEITIITGINNGMSFDQAFDEVLHKKIPLKMARSILKSPMNLQRKTFLEFWRTSQSAKKGDWVAFFKFYWPAFDSWSVGGIIMKFLFSFSMNPVYTEREDWIDTRFDITSLLTGLLQMSPTRRLDCVEALSIYDPGNRVVSSVSGKAWLKEKRAIREAS